MKTIVLDKKLWMDERGWSVALLEAADVRPENARNLHIASMEPGAVRGNHVHPAATEWLLVFGGSVELYWKMEGEASIQVEKADGGRPVLFEIPSGIIHTVYNSSDQVCFLTAFNDQDQPETNRVELNIPSLK